MHVHLEKAIKRVLVSILWTHSNDTPSVSSKITLQSSCRWLRWQTINRQSAKS